MTITIELAPRKPRRGRSRRITPELEGRFALQYRSGSSIRQIAEHEGWSYGAVQGALHRARVPMRRRGGVRGSRISRAS